MNTPNPVQNPYIYTPKSRVPMATRTLHGVLTLLAWALYAYLWLPLLTVVAWVLGIRTAYIELYVRDNRLDQTIFIVIAVLAIVATALLVGWAEYNRRRFGSAHRRAAPRDVEADDVAKSLFAPEGLLPRLSGAKSMRLTMDEDARLVGVHQSTPL